MKYIEKVKPEDAVSDLIGCSIDYNDRLTTEVIGPTYDKETELTAPKATGTVTTTIVETRSVLAAFISKAWYSALTMLGGVSVMTYIADAYSYLRSRLQGDTTYGIPDRRSDISSSSPLATNLEMLSDRKICGVNSEVPDGISLVRILGTSEAAETVTELTDSTRGWNLTSVAAINRMPQTFPNISRIVFGCEECNTNLDGLSTAPEIELEFPYLKRYTQPPISGHIEYMVGGTPSKMIFPELEEYSENPTTGRSAGLIGGYTAPNLLEVRAPKLSRVTIYSNGFSKITQCPKLRIVDFRSLTYFDLRGYSWSGFFPFENCTHLIHLEFKEYTINTQYGEWNPTMALRTDTTAEDYVDLREDTSLANNLEQFLANFSTYIIDRLEQRTASTTLTLTISQAVRDVLTTEQEQAIAAKYWNLSPANKTT